MPWSSVVRHSNVISKVKGCKKNEGLSGIPTFNIFTRLIVFTYVLSCIGERCARKLVKKSFIYETIAARFIEKTSKQRLQKNIKKEKLWIIRKFEMPRNSNWYAEYSHKIYNIVSNIQRMVFLCVTCPTSQLPDNIKISSGFILIGSKGINTIYHKKYCAVQTRLNITNENVDKNKESDKS